MLILVLLYNKLGQLRKQQIHVNATSTLDSNQDSASDKEDATEMSELLAQKKAPLDLKDSGNWWCLLYLAISVCFIVHTIKAVHLLWLCKLCVWPVKKAVQPTRYRIYIQYMSLAVPLDHTSAKCWSHTSRVWSSGCEHEIARIGTSYFGTQRVNHISLSIKY